MLTKAGVDVALAVPGPVAAMPNKERISVPRFAEKPAVAGFLDGKTGSLGAAQNGFGGCHGSGYWSGVRLGMTLSALPL